MGDGGDEPTGDRPADPDPDVGPGGAGDDGQSFLTDGVASFRKLRLFADERGAPRARRPTDAVLLAATMLLLAVATLSAFPPGTLSRDLTQLATDAPNWLDDIWEVLYDLLAVWALLVLASALVRRRFFVLLAALASIVLAVVIAYTAHRLAGGETVDLTDYLGSGTINDRGVEYPGLRLVAVSAVLISVSPSVTRPFRFLGRTILLVGALGAIGLTVTTVAGVIGAVTAGAAGASAVHLAVGSPGGRPSQTRILAALAELGVPIRALEPALLQPAGVVVMRAEHADGRPLVVKVYGRDAWDSQLIAKLWRAAWYRDAQASVLLSRLHQVEHEALISTLAEREHAPAPQIITAGLSSSGDALLVATEIGTPLAPAGSDHDGAPLPTVSRDAVADLWESMTAGHRVGIVHGGIDIQSVVVGADGRLGVTDWRAGDVAATDDLVATERAQLLALSALLVGEDDAVDVAQEVLGTDALGDVVSYLQSPALTRSLNRQLKAQELDLDDLRAATTEAAGADEVELVQLRRVTLGGVVSMIVLALAAGFLISQLADIGFDTIVDQLSMASWGWVLLALLVGQAARIFSGIGTTGATNHPLHLGPTILLEYAITFINLAVPSSAARVATKMRYFQKAGMSLTAASTMGAIDGLAGFTVQISIILAALVFGVGGLELDIDVDTDAVQSLALAILVVVVLIAVGFGVAVLVSEGLRERLRELVRRVREVLSVLKAPDRLLRLFGGNLGAELTFALTLGLCVRAYGESAPLFGLVVVNVGVALFAGLMPVPGGIGVTEAALTTGLIALGIPDATAFAAAITTRLCTFYLPPIWGYVALRWLRGHDYL